MNFNSLNFFVFIVLFFLLWPFFNKKNQPRWIFLTITSFVFYGWWDWRFLFLIIFSGLIDFVSAILIERDSKNKKVYLILSLIGNLGSLAVFKYSQFIGESIELFLQYFGVYIDLQGSIPSFMLILPVGISFYTFQSMSYTLDVYRGHLKPTKSIFHFFAYLALFPQLVAGPIVRAKNLLPQLQQWIAPDEKMKFEGLKLIIFGFFKKVVIADNIAPTVNYAFDSPVFVDSSLYWWVIVFLFSFQIYFDFSGYSDIAIGLGRYLGLRFPENFKNPYVATSFKEFWARWHVSLSSWFRDYVYIPLGGNRSSHIKSIRNIMATMLLSALWHGANWTFLIWGFLHGLYLIVEKITKWPYVLSKNVLGKHIVLILIYSQVIIAWVFFRAQSISQANDILQTMFSSSSDPYFYHHKTSIFFALCAFAYEYSVFVGLRDFIIQTVVYRRLEKILLAITIVACVFLRGPGSEFIYFQF